MMHGLSVGPKWLVLLASLLALGKANSEFYYEQIAHLSVPDVDETLAAVRSGGSEIVEDAHGELRKILNGVAKDGSERFSGDVARQALHKFFMRQHGWHVGGVDVEMDADLSNAAIAMGDLNSTKTAGRWIPSYVVSKLEADAGSSGLDVHDLAVVVSVIYRLVQREIDKRLVEIYGNFGFRASDALAVADAKNVLISGALIFVFASAVRFKPDAEAWIHFVTYGDDINNWESTKAWMLEVAMQHGFKGVDRVDFATVSKALLEIEKHYVDMIHVDCMDVKTELVNLMSRSSKIGRVRLPDFYKQSLYGAWAFTEKQEYLRDLGALDESDKDEPPFVIIPNYVTSPNNCLKGSRLFSICCRSECDALITSLEQGLQNASAEASPESLVSLVEALPSPTVQAPRELPEKLHARLNQIALTNSGVIDLHGRLFAEWMHHAFPLECPYPHEKAAQASSPEVWKLTKNVDDHEESESERRRHVEEDSCPATLTDNTPCGMIADGTEGLRYRELAWSDVDELIIKKGNNDGGLTWWRMAFAVICIAGAVVAAKAPRQARPQAQKWMSACLSVSGMYALRLIGLDIFLFVFVGALSMTVLSLRQEAFSSSVRKAKKLDGDCESCV